MKLRDLVPWRSRESQPLSTRSAESPLLSLQREMDELFDSFAREFGMAPFEMRPGELPVVSPRVDVSETDEAIEVSAELPGMEEKDIDVSLSADALTIRGEKRDEKEETERDYYHRERSYGSFRRDIPLPADVDADNVEARFEHGVLHVTLPKTKQAQSRHKITVKSGK